MNSALFFRQLLGTVVKNKQHKKVAHGIYISVGKNKHNYLAPKNAVSQNVHILGSKRIGWFFAGSFLIRQSPLSMPA